MANKARTMSKRENSQTIDYCLKSLTLQANNTILEGMEKVARAGLQYLIDAHNAHSGLMLHTTEVNTLAWALAHDGHVVKAGCHEGNEFDLPGNAQSKAEEIASHTHGWTVIILSDMEGWYREDYEMDFLVDAQFGVADNFHTFFKKFSL